MNASSRRRPGRPSLSNEQLLDTALDLFLERGFERTGIEAICAAAGMAKRTVYARYGDKTVLFRAALERAIGEWIVPVERLAAVEQDDIEATLIEVGAILVANIMTPAGLRLLRLTNAESGRLPEIGEANVREGTAPTVAWLAALFRRRLGLEAWQAEQAGEAFLNLVVGGPALAAAWGVRRGDEEIAAHMRYCVALFLHGLLAGSARNAGLADENRRLRSLIREAAQVLAHA